MLIIPMKRRKPPSFYIAAGYGGNMLTRRSPMSITPNAQRSVAVISSSFFER